MAGTDPRAVALAQFLDIPAAALDLDPTWEDVFWHDRTPWLVLDTISADIAVEEELDRYMNEVLAPGIPAGFLEYFNFGRWRDDQLAEGRGPWLSCADGIEHQVRVGEQLFFIYRME